jgi:integrase
VKINNSASVRGPEHKVKKGKTPILAAEEARTLLDSIDASSALGMRDRALIALMIYTFARVGAALKMRVEDAYVQGRRTWVRLHEKAGKRHEMPCHHALEAYLHAYIDSAGFAGEAKGFLFRTTIGRSGTLTTEPMGQSDAWRMIRRRTLAAGVRTRACNHSFRATGITECLKNGEKLEIAQQMANHESARTTGLYDRRDDQVSLDEVERILI